MSRRPTTRALAGSTLTTTRPWQACNSCWLAWFSRVLLLLCAGSQTKRLLLWQRRGSERSTVSSNRRRPAARWTTSLAWPASCAGKGRACAAMVASQGGDVWRATSRACCPQRHPVRVAGPCNQPQEQDGVHEEHVSGTSRLAACPRHSTETERAWATDWPICNQRTFAAGRSGCASAASPRRLSVG